MPAISLAKLDHAFTVAVSEVAKCKGEGKLALGPRPIEIGGVYKKEPTSEPRCEPEEPATSAVSTEESEGEDTEIQHLFPPETPERRISIKPAPAAGRDVR